MVQNTHTTVTDAQEVVLAFLNALNEQEYGTAGGFLDENMKFQGVLGSRDGREAYITDMSKMQFRYAVQKVFTDGNDVCVFYDINMSGKIIPTCGWYHVTEGRIDSLKVLFDPRPVL